MARKGSGEGQLTMREAGHRGGSTTSRKYGLEFYQGIGHKGGATTSKRYGHEYYVKIGRMSGALKKRQAKARRAAAKAAQEAEGKGK